MTEAGRDAALADTHAGPAPDEACEHVSATPARPPGARGTVIALAGVLIAVAFFGAYLVAVRSALGASGNATTSVACDSSAADCGGDSAMADACGGECGSAGAAEAPVGRAVLEQGAQSIDVDVSAGYFDPTVIELTAGVPTRITFGEGSGCLAEVQFPELGIEADLTSGGAVVELPALEPGQYVFSCGMEMVCGALVVR